MSDVSDHLADQMNYKERDAKISCVTLCQDFNNEYQEVKKVLTLLNTVSRNFSNMARGGNIVEAANFLSPRHGLVFGLVKDIERKCESMNALQEEIQDKSKDIPDFQASTSAVWSFGLQYKKEYDVNSERYANFQERMSAVSDGLSQVGHIADDHSLSVDDLKSVLHGLSDDLDHLKDGQVNDFAL